MPEKKNHKHEWKKSYTMRIGGEVSVKEHCKPCGKFRDVKQTERPKRASGMGTHQTTNPWGE